MKTGWLDDITDWLREQFEKLFGFLVDLAKDAILWFFEKALELSATIIEKIPVPEFLENLGIGSMLQQAGPVVAWAVTTFKLAEAFALIGGAYAFRLVRKVMTMGRW